MNLSKKLKEIRINKGLNQSDIAKKINKNLRTYQKYEEGSISPPVSVLEDICNVYNIKLSELLSDDNIKVATMDFKIEEILKDKYIVEIDITENRVHISDNKAINVTLSINEFNELKNYIIMDIENKICFIDKFKKGE